MPGQAFPQVPQFAASILVSVQAPLHSMNGRVQAKSQVPRAQVAVALAGGIHTLPQAPQLDVLLMRSTQDPLQSVSVPPQPAAHLPSPQTDPAPQGLPQAPQLALSDSKSTQLPLQLL